MSSSFLEIIELENGEIVLKRVDDDSEPLVSIRFSEESKSYIDGAAIDVAKVMIQAGIQAAAHYNGTNASEEASQPVDTDRVIH